MYTFQVCVLMLSVLFSKTSLITAEALKNVIIGMKVRSIGASLVAQWLRICLPMQGTQVRALAWEDPTCRGATKAVRHNY